LKFSTIFFSKDITPQASLPEQPGYVQFVIESYGDSTRPSTKHKKVSTDFSIRDRINLLVQAINDLRSISKLGLEMNDNDIVTKRTHMLKVIGFSGLMLFRISQCSKYNLLLFERCSPN
jgi:hypothetical protein